jgi:hypothetical protein
MIKTITVSCCNPFTICSNLVTGYHVDPYPTVLCVKKKYEYIYVQIYIEL